ncbi:hypothetical protein N7462_001850 [Penicillium macrosclerotiorum]|uniref:uncharacterized protein n=1 Tax=Penicillium macrosclerotiorum TaxID=303699 RepID=UPI002547BC7A|nr:uncharacterized protein N7462_001850 [Penicillium macrosclerotiorum]KAJ5692427.1 hypothetical protein N7462_001850 [Penicillium macrosclerotiorum]
MTRTDDTFTDVPGTVYLIDSIALTSISTASHAFQDAAFASQQDILLIPQPSNSLADPLVRLRPDFLVMWSSPIVAIACLVVGFWLKLRKYRGFSYCYYIFTFDGTMFPRYRFNAIPDPEESQANIHKSPQTEKENPKELPISEIASHCISEDISPRSYRQRSL